MAHAERGKIDGRQQLIFFVIYQVVWVLIDY